VELGSAQEQGFLITEQKALDYLQTWLKNTMIQLLKNYLVLSIFKMIMDLSMKYAGTFSKKNFFPSLLTD
jgi:hypothetical protein